MIVTEAVKLIDINASITIGLTGMMIIIMIKTTKKAKKTSLDFPKKPAALDRPRLSESLFKTLLILKVLCCILPLFGLQADLTISEFLRSLNKFPLEQSGQFHTLYREYALKRYFS